MTGKHFKWHKYWQVDLSTSSVEHASGLIVAFVEGMLDIPPEIGTLAYTNDGREWTGSLQGGESALNEWLQMQASQGLRDPASVTNRLARLMREAGEVWARERSRDHQINRYVRQP